jgi:carboxymethylproline synthase
MAALLDTDLADGVLTVRFRGVTSLNPISAALNLAIQDLCARSRDDDSVKAMVFTGGDGRSFCAGGDFNEVSAMRTGADVDAWIDRTLDLYLAVLAVDKPTVAAVDGFAIGIGFQLALACDLRVATPEAKFLMWELKHGIACTIGSYMLERFVGRAMMLDLIYDCEPLDLRRGLDNRLIHSLTPAGTLIDAARRLASRIVAYPELPRRETKRVVNADFIAGLRGVGPESRRAHREAFAAQSASQHFQKVLNH